MGHVWQKVRPPSALKCEMANLHIIIVRTKQLYWPTPAQYQRLTGGTTTWISLLPNSSSLSTAWRSIAQAEVAKATKPLQDLIDLVNSCVEIKLVNGSVVSEINLSAFELEALAMRIPAECSRLQSQLNQYNVKNMFRDMKMDAKVTVELAKLTGTKGAAEERKKKAEMTVLDERVQNAVNKLIIRSIQGCIDRADKVYEGVKKVMDFRSKEGFFDRKGART